MTTLGNCLEIHDKEENWIAAKVTPMHASVQDLKQGSWFTNDNTGLPGTIKGVKMSKTGKHGHAKFTFNVSYPFSETTSQEMFPGHTHLTRPVMTKSEGALTWWDEGSITYLNEN